MKFCIIGGNGRMGRLFENILLNDGHEVMIIGRKNYDELSLAIDSADITIISTPLGSSKNNIMDVKKTIKPDKLVIDFSSYMDNNVKSLMDLPCQSAFLHLLFGPEVGSVKGLNTILVPINHGEKIKELSEILKSLKLNVIISSVEKHDKYMALFQALLHFNTLLFMKTFSDMKISENDMTQYSTYFFNASRSLYARILNQSPEMLAHIEFDNQYFMQILLRHKANFEEMLRIVANHDFSGFEDIFNSAKETFSIKESNLGQKLQNNEECNDANCIAVLGPRGSFSDAACSEYIKKNPELKKIYFESIQEVIYAIKTGKSRIALLPMENSINGTVIETIEGINYSDLQINESIEIPIHHCIAILPNSKREDIQAIYSHQQALKQCARFIEKNFPKARLIETLSTSNAFEKITKENLLNAAAIGPQYACDIYGFKVLKKSIEDMPNNKTRFAIITQKQETAQDGSITSTVIIPLNERQGLLYDLLGYFNEKKINLTKIESRPMRDRLGKYIFYIDCEINSKDPRFKEVVMNIEKDIGHIKILGCYNINGSELL